ncbi:MAG: hypothetical protein NTW03_15050 [Verrucomicrobia bacterium]|nr:hypothetical protein [Verrucomicrobiota bacterium]
MQRRPARSGAQPSTAPMGAPPASSDRDYFAEVITHYTPAAYDGLVDLFVAEDARADQQPFLRHFIRGGLNIHHVPGTHREMLHGDNLQPFSQVFAEALRKAQARTASTQSP